MFTWCAPTAADEILVATAVATVQHAINDVVLFAKKIANNKQATEEIRDGMGWRGVVDHTRAGGALTAGIYYYE